MITDPANDLSDLIERFDHIALAVHDIQKALPLIDLLGGVFSAGADHRRNQFRWVQFQLADRSKLELIAPLAPDSFLTRFLKNRGEGVHHITYKVADVDQADRRSQSLGFRTTGLHLHPEWSEVFIHPRDALGTVIQLAAWGEESAWSTTTLADVLAGRSVDDT